MLNITFIMAKFSVLVILMYSYRVFTCPQLSREVQLYLRIINANFSWKPSLVWFHLTKLTKTTNLTCKIMTINHDYRSRIMIIMIIIIVPASPDNAILLSPISALGLSIAFQLHWAKMHLRRTRSSFVKQHPHSFLTVPLHFPIMMVLHLL